MSIIVTCDSCGHTVKVADKHAGRSFACPHCRTVVRVPAASSPAEAVRPPEPAQPATPPPPEATPPLASTHAGTPSLPPEYEPPLTRSLHKGHQEDLIDMTAMVDIVFFLLIFFLVTSFQAVDSAIELPIPSAQKGAGAPKPVSSDAPVDPPDITVNIDKTDRITIDGTEIRNPDELLLKLRELRGTAGRSVKMLVVGSGDATHGTLVTVLDTGQEVGVENIRLSIKEEAKPATIAATR